MPYCAACRPPHIAEAVAIYTADGPGGYLQAGTCARHANKVRAWAAETGGPVRERHLAPTGQATTPTQEALFDMEGA
ncbi:hypothetical protein [Actinopolymorpha alba]|uniref:hypothetical protein n=1 Tax=Actinopolymorpha alba TaxID=533267 RepID=UPI00036AA35C|nr:hypothetical protein [Actinopolymorpha alba]